MPGANRNYVPGYVWHITYRSHNKEFLLKFNRDKDNWIKWLFEAKKRYGLCILNFMVTSNHIHLMVFDNGISVSEFTGTMEITFRTVFNLYLKTG
jgi:putative transposase